MNGDDATASPLVGVDALTGLAADIGPHLSPDRPPRLLRRPLAPQAQALRGAEARLAARAGSATPRHRSARGGAAVSVLPAAFTPIVDALEDVEAAAAQVVLAASEAAQSPGDELGDAISRLATTLLVLQESRARAMAIAAEVATPPLHVVGS